MNAETKICGEVKAALEKIGVYCVRVQSGTLHGGRIRLAPKGTPDLIVCTKGGAFIGLEVKVPGGKRRPEQVECQRAIRRLGGVCEFVQSVDEAIAIVDGV